MNIPKCDMNDEKVKTETVTELGQLETMTQRRKFSVEVIKEKSFTQIYRAKADALGNVFLITAKFLGSVPVLSLII